MVEYQTHAICWFRYEMVFNTISVKYLIALFAGRVFCVKYNTVVFNIKLHVPKVTWAPSEYQAGLSRFGINIIRIRRSWDVCCLQISNESQAAICSCDDRQTGLRLWRNSSGPRTAYMRQWTNSTLSQAMACRLLGAKPLTEPMLTYYTPRFNEVERGVYWYHLVRLVVCGQNRVRSVSSTILIGYISYLHILSSNFRRCVACNARFKIQTFEILANF